jgi:hypothetical protein
MPIITPVDLSTNIYPEIIDEITRADSTISNRAIAAAILEAKMYLARFDLDQLFGTGHTPPTVEDEYLKCLVKDIACWYLIRLSNPGIDQTVYRTAYQDAIAALKSIQSGHTQPQGWPYLDTTSESAPEGNTVSWASNPRRDNYY